MRNFNHPTLKDVPLYAVLHALGDPARIAFAQGLYCGAVLNCGELSKKAHEALSPSTVNHHLRILREAGLIFSERSGVQVHNRLRLDEVEKRFPGLLAVILKP
ncbi:MAG TPA: helix-turn-helix domain-containing protein [Alphaproteobacteria bacterium]|nr:helix-turn-helix domain-containing protein [Alphaproteobacteria bacterium]